jgi:hypothetical protein
MTTGVTEPINNAAESGANPGAEIERERARERERSNSAYVGRDNQVLSKEERQNAKKNAGGIPGPGRVVLTI